MTEIAGQDPAENLDEHGFLYDPGDRIVPRTLAPFFEMHEKFIAAYNFEPNKLTIFDPVWGRIEIGSEEGDEVLLELADHHLVRRLLNVGQLTLDELAETVPDTADFTRYEHLWGSVALVRLLTKDVGLSARERLVLQLRAFVSDLGHTSGSHRGDWLFQGQGGPEDQHESELMNILEAVGLNDVLRKHGIEPAEVVFPGAEDFVENSLPNLCVDRLDYGARQLRRMFKTVSDVYLATRPETFKLVDGQLVMSDEKSALAFAKAFLLLATEHWEEPVHLLQLHLDQELVRRILTSSETALLASGGSRKQFNPRDYLYTIDRDITMEMRFRDPFINTARTLMEDIALSRRRIYAWERSEQLARFLHSEDGDLPDPIRPYGYADDYSLLLSPPNITIIHVDKPAGPPDFAQRPDTYDVVLPSLKPRAVDPLFVNENGQVSRLSDANPYFRMLLEQQAAMLSRNYVARVHVNQATKARLEEGVRQNHAKWAEVLERPRMGQDRFNHLVKDMANLAVLHSQVILNGDSQFRSF